MADNALYSTRCLLTLIDILSRDTVNSRTLFTSEFRDFNIGIADCSVFLAYDAVSMDNQILIFRRKILL